jgi:GNAT superfamily N-acetyltransferase
MEIRRATTDDRDACVAIVAALPDHFTPSTHDEVRRDVGAHPSWVAEEEDEIVGFALASRRFALGAEITFAAVLPHRHDQGVGTALLELALEDLATAGVRMVEVKTLDASAGYEPYVATRAFWERRGFVQIDCIDPLPGWDPGNPSAIYARALPLSGTGGVGARGTRSGRR